VFRNRTNYVSGLILQFMMIGVWILTDPLELRGPLPPDQSFGLLGAAGVPLSLGLFATLALAVWWYPSVEVSDSVLIIRNPLKTHVIPRRDITAIDTSRTYTQVITEARSYRCASLENSLSMLIRQDPDATAGDLREPTSSCRQHPDLGSATIASSSWRRPSTLEFVVVSGWIVLAIVSAIARWQS
jgi:hypothetical protein